MVNKFKNLLKGNFVKNVFIVATGTAAAQALSLVLQPFITRLYGPEAYGFMGIFIAIIAILGPISALTFPSAIVLPKEDREANTLINLSLIITVILTFASTLILLLFKDDITHIFNLEGLQNFLFLIPFIIFFAGLHQVMEQWLIRTNQFKSYAKITFLHVFLIQGSKVGIGLYQPIAAVLIVLTAIGEGVRAVMMALIDRRINYKEILKLRNFYIYKGLIIRYKDFPVFRAPQMFINSISQNLPVLMLTAFFGPASAGFFVLSRTVLNMPTQLIGKSVGDVFYPRISAAKNNNEDLYILIKKATLSLALIGILPFSIVIIFGPQIFSIVFGEEWFIAGEYARWISLWLYFMFLNQPVIKAIPVLALQAFQLRYTIITLFIRLSALAVGYYVFSSELVAIALFGISGAIRTLYLTIIILKKSRK